MRLLDAGVSSSVHGAADPPCPALVPSAGEMKTPPAKPEFQCGRCLNAWFPSQRGLQSHLGKCMKRFPAGGVGRPETVRVNGADDGADEATRASLYEATRQAHVLADLSTLRYDKFFPASHLELCKEMVKSWVNAAQKEVMRRMAPLLNATLRPKLKETLDVTMDVFKGLETEKLEAAVLAETLPLLALAPRVLGKRALTVTDAEGIKWSSKVVSCHTSCQGAGDTGLG